MNVKMMMDKRNLTHEELYSNEKHVFPKCWHQPTNPHGTKTQDNTNITLTAVRMSYPIDPESVNLTF
jgi:hypothetical protein